MYHVEDIGRLFDFIEDVSKRDLSRELKRDPTQDELDEQIEEILEIIG